PTPINGLAILAAVELHNPTPNVYSCVPVRLNCSSTTLNVTSTGTRVGIKSCLAAMFATLAAVVPLVTAHSPMADTLVESPTVASGAIAADPVKVPAQSGLIVVPSLSHSRSYIATVSVEAELDQDRNQTALKVGTVLPAAVLIPLIPRFIRLTVMLLGTSRTKYMPPIKPVCGLIKTNIPICIQVVSYWVTSTLVPIAGWT